MKAVASWTQKMVYRRVRPSSQCFPAQRGPLSTAMPSPPYLSGTTSQISRAVKFTRACRPSRPVSNSSHGHLVKSARRPQSNTHRQLRTGFSLIDLLVVVTIMGVVIAMLVTALGVGGAAARRGATITTIRKVDSLLTAKVDALKKDFDEQERKKTRADVISAPAARKTNWFNVLSNAEALPGLYPMVSLYASTPLAVRVAIVKMDRYRGMFPQRVRDLYGLNDTDDGGTYFDDSPLLDYWKSTTPVWNGVTRVPSAH